MVFTRKQHNTPPPRSICGTPFTTFNGKLTRHRTSFLHKTHGCFHSRCWIRSVVYAVVVTLPLVLYIVAFQLSVDFLWLFKVLIC